MYSLTGLDQAPAIPSVDTALIHISFLPVCFHESVPSFILCPFDIFSFEFLQSLDHSKCPISVPCAGIAENINSIAVVLPPAHTPFVLCGLYGTAEFVFICTLPGANLDTSTFGLSTTYIVISFLVSSPPSTLAITVIV